MRLYELVDKAINGAEEALVKYYVEEICDDETEDDALEYVEELKENKENWENELFHKKVDRLYDLMKYVKKTNMSDEDKAKAINYIKSNETYQEHEKRIAMMFANHFCKYKDAYLK